jgi:hypothetical protein
MLLYHNAITPASKALGGVISGRQAKSIQKYIIHINISSNLNKLILVVN